MLALASDLAAHPNDPLLGSRIGDQFMLVSRLGEGGFGVVYRAVQAPVGRVVAVKVLKESARRDPSGAARFFQEARAIGALKHPATVKLISCGESPRSKGRTPWIYIAMEYIEGPTLKDIIQAQGALPPARAVAIAAEALDALAEAHRRNIVHRDLKPENIILEPEPPGPPRVRVVDFGISKVLKDTDPLKVASIHTRRGFIVGTTAYAAPERVLGHEARPTSDLYSMGVMLYEMLTGALPFNGEEAQDILRAHVEAPIPELPEGIQVPTALRIELRRALSKRPEGRHQSAKALADALVAAVERAGEAGAGLARRRRERAEGRRGPAPDPGGPQGLEGLSVAPKPTRPPVDPAPEITPAQSLLVGDKPSPQRVHPIAKGAETEPYVYPERRGPEGTRLISRGGQKPSADRGLSWKVALLIGGLMGAIGAAISWGVARSAPARYDAPRSTRPPVRIEDDVHVQDSAALTSRRPLTDRRWVR